MELQSTPFVYLILLSNIILSIYGFQNHSFLEKSLFRPLRILKNKEYERLIQSGFVHGSWPHLFFNMYSLYLFGKDIELFFGWKLFLCIYFSSLLGGSLLSLLIHRNDTNYAALGASGAVNGVLFASVLLFPHNEIGLFFIPVFVPGWAFAILYTLYTMYGMKSQHDGIGHDAHMGGAIVGMLTTIAFLPGLCLDRPLLIAAILIPSSIFLYLMVNHPALIGMDPIAPKAKKKMHLDDHYNQIREEKQKELDRILDKINRLGVDSLDDYEKRFLDMNT